MRYSELVGRDWMLSRTTSTGWETVAGRAWGWGRQQAYDDGMCTKFGSSSLAPRLSARKAEQGLRDEANNVQIYVTFKTEQLRLNEPHLLEESPNMLNMFWTIPSISYIC